jgi:hypothetical protein
LLGDTVLTAGNTAYRHGDGVVTNKYARADEHAHVDQYSDTGEHVYHSSIRRVLPVLYC